MNQENYTLEVLVNGRGLREYRKEGRSFIEGREQTQYSLRIRNNSFKRVLALVSVDGIGAISGQAAQDNDAGYIIEAWDAIEIKGFRESDTAVGAFLFTDRDQSYAKGQGAPQNIGVIGVRIIEEKVKPVQLTKRYLAPPPITDWRDTMPIYSGAAVMDWMEQERSLVPRGVTTDSYSCSVNSLSAEPTRSFDLGTTWGKRVKDRVVTVQFERGKTLETLELFYASRRSLEAMGIRFIEETPVAFPQSFPAYAKPPAGWKG